MDLSFVTSFFSVAQVWVVVVKLLICILVAALFFCGLYFIITDFMIMPSKRARRSMLNINKKKLSTANQMIMALSNNIAKMIKMSPQRRALLQRKLYSAEIEYTPEFYVARAISAAVIVAALGLLTCIITPFMFFVCAILAVAVYFKAYQEADDIIRKKSEKIQGELVLFASTIQTQLATSHDVIKIFESYRKICSVEMAHELDITIADMKTGSYENALRRFDTRIQSQSLSEIIRGLLAVLRGDDQRTYFEMLVHDLIIKERERLKREAGERPKKMKTYSFLILGTIGLIFFYVIGYQIVTELQGMF